MRKSLLTLRTLRTVRLVTLWSGSQVKLISADGFNPILLGFRLDLCQQCFRDFAGYA